MDGPREIPEWETFAREVAQIGEVPIAKISSETRLVEDLGFDSLALAELVAFVSDSYVVRSGFEELVLSAWNGLTVGQLFESISIHHMPVQSESSGPNAGGRD